MIEFYSPDIESTGLLPEGESAHAVRVLRLKEGDELMAVDGKGGRYRCRLIGADPRGAAVEIVEKREERPHWGVRITLAVAPTKNADRLEWFAEKAVEIGVDEIVLIKCEHSERKVMKTERLKRVMLAAMKQSLKSRLPLLSELTGLSEFLKQAPQGQRFMGYCSDSVERKEFAREYRAGSDVTILIGPEGDFSPCEVEACQRAGFLPVTFGESRLRTETAALFAVQAVHVINQLR